jgi:hypothetical protein
MSKPREDACAVSKLISKKLQLHPVRIRVRGSSMLLALAPSQKVAVVAMRQAEALAEDIERLQPVHF